MDPRRPMERPTVTFYIPAYNAAAYLDEVLLAVLAQTYPVERVLVIDDGSTDETVAVASRYPVEIIRQPENRGLAAARNTALRAAETQLVAAVDSDVVVDPGWLEAMVRNLEDPKVAVVTGCLVERYQETPPDRWRALHMKQNYGPQRIVNPGPFSGSNHVLRRSVAVESGGFNESFRTNNEDCDMAARLRDQGWDIVYEPAARAEHLRRDTVRSVARTKWSWDYWAKQGEGHYRNRGRVLLDNLRIARWRLAQHLGRPRLMVVDLAMLWLHTRWDLELLSSKRASI
jgi:mycofactocin glycosyltransferase